MEPGILTVGSALASLAILAAMAATGLVVMLLVAFVMWLWID